MLRGIAPELHILGMGITFVMYVMAMKECCTTHGGGVKQKIPSQHLNQRFLNVSCKGLLHRGGYSLAEEGHPSASPSSSPRRITDGCTSPMCRGCCGTRLLMLTLVQVSAMQARLQSHSANAKGALVATKRTLVLPRSCDLSLFSQVSVTKSLTMTITITTCRRVNVAKPSQRLCKRAKCKQACDFTARAAKCL